MADKMNSELDRATDILKKLSAHHAIPELVFDKVQQFQKLKDFYNIEKEKLGKVFGGNALDIHQVGSTAIRGMPGTREIDMLVIVQSWPPSEAVSAKMVDIGYENFGPAPHYENDIWFLKKLGQNNYQDYGDCCVHIMEKGNVGVQKMIAFVDYCNADPEAAEAYKHIKLEASKSSDFKDYKYEKMIKMQPLMNKACEWKQNQK